MGGSDGASVDMTLRFLIRCPPPNLDPENLLLCLGRLRCTAFAGSGHGDPIIWPLSPCWFEAERERAILSPDWACRLVAALCTFCRKDFQALSLPVRDTSGKWVSNTRPSATQLHFSKNFPTALFNYIWVDSARWESNELKLQTRNGTEYQKELLLEMTSSQGSNKARENMCSYPLIRPSHSEALQPIHPSTV